jgi:hypothetical protein
VDEESGQGGPLGVVADWWDSHPTTGAVGVVSSLLGLVLASGALLFGDAEPGPMCQADPLHAVYKPSRLKVLEPCAKVTGTVMAYRKEHDGDFHVSMVMDAPGWTNSLNNERQHGYTVVEFIPLMPKPDRFKVGQRLSMTGTKVLDLQHGDHRTTGWIELHPVFGFTELTDPKTTPPNVPKLAPATEGEG